MSNTPHTLRDEFPDQAQKLHDLKLANAHFARLLTEYDEVNDKVHRAETRVDLLADADEAVLRKRRAQLKDDIARMLRG